ncbi:hypothetical protein J2T58_000525 [Methanocalculus alkaliphilus]|nr:hypothetical protein [Methanocalculus alkaliphilus]
MRSSYRISIIGVFLIFSVAVAGCMILLHGRRGI